jgi:hypothetical protein
MQGHNTFIIESEQGSHRLLFNEQQIGTFGTLAAAEKEAVELAECAVPGITLHFDLDLKWTLSDLEIRSAAFETESPQANQK